MTLRGDFSSKLIVPFLKPKHRRKILQKIYLHVKRSRRRNVKTESEFVLVGSFPQISYADILRATEGLNQNNLNGVDTFGFVFKGILANGDSMISIKVLYVKNRTASKSVMEECETLRNIKHQNLVKIIIACSTIDFQGNDLKALVYEYMKNGSLKEWPHPKDETEGLRQKLSLIVAIDIACAVEYLHRECETPVIYCDLTPSNVLLDTEMTAYVGDFGLARILSSDEVILQTHSVGVRGTIGYSLPGYGMGGEVSREGDVYSYGILLLELFTGKRPTDDVFEDAWNIRSYCVLAAPERVNEIIDPCLVSNEFCEEGAGMPGEDVCRESPGERTDIRKAAVKLRTIKAWLMR